MFVGRQLGHIRAGHFRWWFFKEVVGSWSIWACKAWRRRCHYTADRIGLLLAGDLRAAQYALVMITVGTRIAPSTNLEDIVEQRERLFDNLWSWFWLSFSSYPSILDRIIKLEKFSGSINESARPGVGSLTIDHRPLRTLPILIIHGHDRFALLELKDFLYSNFPEVMPAVMSTTGAGALTLPEKFEAVAAEVRGAIALLTPDDIGGIARDLETSNFRARQNVVVEIGWIWGKLGRRRCLVLVRGNVEMPSDLSGLDMHSFEASPNECTEAVRGFITQLEFDQT
jgi:hypothetical protein